MKLFILLIFWEGELSPKNISPVFKKLVKEKYAQEFKLLDNKKLEDWIKKRVAQAQGKIQEAAIKILAGLVGSDLWQINNELTKLLAYKNGQEIEPADIYLFVRGKFDDNIFNLVDAIGERNKARALKLLNDQLAGDVHFAYILTMIIRQFRILLKIKSALAESAGNQYALAKDLGLHPFVVKKAMSQTLKYNLGQLKKIYQKLLALDFKIKTSQAAPKVLLDLLVAEIN